MSEPEPKISVTRSCEICGLEVTMNHIAGLKRKKFKCSNCLEVRIGILRNSVKCKKISVFFLIDLKVCYGINY